MADLKSSDYIKSPNGSSGGYTPVPTMTTSGTILVWGSDVPVDTTNGVITVNLPTSILGTKGLQCRIRKITNDNNPVLIKGFGGTETINGKTDGIYLYNQFDSIEIMSNGVGVSVTGNDNRNTVSNTGSFVRATRTSAQTSFNPQNVIFSTVDTVLGSNISTNTTTGIFTLKANSTYSLKGYMGSLTSNGFENRGSCIWQKSIDGGTTWTSIGTAGSQESPFMQWKSTSESQIATATVTTTVTTLVKLYITDFYNVGALGGSNDFVIVVPWCEIEEKQQQVSITNTVDYISAYQSTQMASAVVNTPLQINTIIEGNMVLNSDYTVTLKTGKTYSLLGGYPALGMTADFEYAFFDKTNNKFIQSNNAHVLTEAGSTISATYTPPNDAKVGLYIRNVSASGQIGMTNMGSNRIDVPWITITQIGNTGVTNIPNTLVSPFTGATATVNGTTGGVPIPLAGQQNYVLSASGWTDIISKIYPVGHILMTENSSNPNTYLGVGTWVEYGTGKVPIGIDTTQTEFNAVGKTGGAKTVTLNSNQIPPHQHSIKSEFGTTSNLNSGPPGSYNQLTTRNYLRSDYTTLDGGGGQAHENLPPYIVCYMWKRTA